MTEGLVFFAIITAARTVTHERVGGDVLDAPKQPYPAAQNGGDSKRGRAMLAPTNEILRSFEQRGNFKILPVMNGF